MTDYQPLIARAVEGLGKSTGEARRGLYERARSALVTQLRSVDPPLSESEITRERLSLEEAIRKVEAEAARKARLEARAEPRFEPRPLRLPSRPVPAEMPAAAAPPPPPSPPPAPPPRDLAEPPPDDDFNEPEQAAAPPPPPPPPPQRPAPTSARGRLLGARTSASIGQEGLRGFRDVMHDVDDLGSASARAAQSARDTRDTYEPQPRRLPQAEDLDETAHDHGEPELNLDDFGAHEVQQPESLEQAFELDTDQPFPQPSGRGRSPRPPEGEYEQSRPPRSFIGAGLPGGVIKLVVVCAILGFIGALAVWQWPNLMHLVAQFSPRHQAPATAPTTPSEPKFPGRVPQEQQPGQAPSTGAPNQPAPAVAQRVVLYEEDPSDPNGKRFVGSAIWRTETVSPGPGLAPDLAVRADIEIPDRRMTVTWSLRRNTDKALPASHTIEIMFNLPSDFPGGGIANVPGVLMKQAEQARGTPLAGLAVKVTNGFFLIGLSAVDADRTRNVQLLKDQEWFDIPVVYTNGGRAILAVEKGPPGDRAFADAFAAWAK